MATIIERLEKFPPGVIGFSLGEIVRYVGFVISLQRVARPLGTYTSIGQSVSISENMNTIIRAMEPQSRWLWIQSDDHQWEDDCLLKLLECELDVVVPMMVRRSPPFIPLINDRAYRDKSHRNYGWDKVPTSGVFEVASTGSGGMLLKREVLDAIREMQGHDRVFEVDKGDKLAEDYVLCRKIHKAGFKIHCCAEVTVGHQGTFTVWPHLDGTWKVRFDMGRDPNGVMQSYWVDSNELPGG